MREAPLPEGWIRVSDWCLRSADGEYTICKVFVAGWVYELWKGKEQVSVGMFTALDAIRLHGSTTATSREAGAKSSPSLNGAPQGQLSFIEAS